MGKAGTKQDRLAALSESTIQKNYSEIPDSYNDIVSRYLADTPMEHRRKFGQFFTPEPIAALMMNWVMANEPQSILDPAVGPGIFLSEFLKKKSDAVFTAIDLDDNALTYAKSIGGAENVNFHLRDFLEFDGSKTFDAIVANPPYLRHHDFEYQYDIFNEIGNRNEISISRQTNIYGLFLLEICRRLNDGGRAAVIIPAEWTNANFGMAIKKFLLRGGYINSFVYFSHDSLTFTDSLATACVLLIEKPAAIEKTSLVRTFYVEGEVDMNELSKLIQKRRDSLDGVLASLIPNTVLEAERKWDFIMRNGSAEKVLGLVPLREIATTRRGIATGANEFFHLSEDAAKQKGIRDENLFPCIGKAGDVEGLVFDKNDFEGLIRRDHRTHLVRISGRPNEEELAYLEEGTDKELHMRFITAARKRWYAVEQRPVAPIWAAVFGRTGLRFVRNRAEAENLTTFHCIYPKDASLVIVDAMTVCLNSRMLQERSRRQHRVYGGGLLKMEPKDLLEVELPHLPLVADDILLALANELDGMNESFRQHGFLYDELAERVDNFVHLAINSAAARILEVEMAQAHSEAA